MDLLSAFGLVAVTAMLICYAFEYRSAAFVLAFAGACALGSIYGFMQGAVRTGRGGMGRDCGPAVVAAGVQYAGATVRCTCSATTLTAR